MTRFWRVLLILVAFAGSAEAQGRGGELAALADWVARSQQQAPLDGKVARALGLSPDGRPLRALAVTTPYLDGERTVYLLRSEGGEQILFSQGRATQGRWLLTNRGGALLRAVEWLPTSSNPQPLDPTAVRTAFTETKAFWKAQVTTRRR